MKNVKKLIIYKVLVGHDMLIVCKKLKNSWNREKGNLKYAERQIW